MISSLRGALAGLLLGASASLLAVHVHAQARVIDDVGAAVVLSAPARRIVTLAPHATELVFAAGAGAALVATIKGSDFPREAAALPVIGDVNGLDLERILALHPDLVVTWPYTVPAQVAILRERGIAVFTTAPATLDGIADDLERIGELSGTGVPAHAAAERLRDKLAQLKTTYGGRQRVRVFYQVGDAPIFTLGGTHYVSRALELCGGTNVFAALSIPAPQVGIEAVLDAQPDAVVAATAGGSVPRWLDGWRQWRSFTAAQHGNLYVVDADLLHRPGPRIAQGVEALCKVIDEARRHLESSPGKR